MLQFNLCMDRMDRRKDRQIDRRTIRRHSRVQKVRDDSFCLPSPVFMITLFFQQKAQSFFSVDLGIIAENKLYGKQTFLIFSKHFLFLWNTPLIWWFLKKSERSTTPQADERTQRGCGGNGFKIINKNFKKELGTSDPKGDIKMIIYFRVLEIVSAALYESKAFCAAKTHFTLLP